MNRYRKPRASFVSTDTRVGICYEAADSLENAAFSLSGSKVFAISGTASPRILYHHHHAAASASLVPSFFAWFGFGLDRRLCGI